MTPPAPTEGLQVLPIHGLPEVAEGVDLAGLILDQTPMLYDGDIVVVASKIVSKSEGRVVAGESREAAIDAETVRVVARRGDTRIVETRHGFVMAAAGVDNSNVAPGLLVLLPLDPDASARRLRAALRQHTGLRLGVIVTDTFGRPWRIGQTDLAVGAAGVQALDDYGGGSDSYGNPLAVTAPAYADEIASAAELVMGKLAGVPASVVRGLSAAVTDSDGPGVRALVRGAEMDMFRLGSREAAVETAYTPRGADQVGASAPDPDVLRAVLASAPTELTLIAIDVEPARSKLVASLGLGQTQAALLIACLPTSEAGETAEPSALLDAGAAIDTVLLRCVTHELATRWIRPHEFDPAVVHPLLEGYAVGDPLGVLALSGR